MDNVPDAAIDWNQSSYIAFRISGTVWATIDTCKTQLVFNLRTSKPIFDSKTISERLGCAVFDRSMDLGEKFNRKSSVEYLKQKDGYYRLRIRIRSDFQIDTPALADLLRQWRAALG